MRKFLSFHSLGSTRTAPRFWTESRTLESLGFTPGTPLMIEILHQGLTITPAVISNNHVSRRRSPAWDRPIIDINSSRILGHLTAFDELKVVGSFERLDVTPSIRAFNITRAKAHTGPHRVLDLFSGGGTISDGLAGNPAFKVVAGVDIDPDFSDEFAAKNPEADIILGDFRRMMPGSFRTSMAS